MQITLILIPATVYILLTLVFMQKMSIRGALEAFVKGHLALFTFIVISVETLSLIDGVSFFFVLTSWLLLVLVCFVTSLRCSKTHDFILLQQYKKDPITIILIGAIALILIATFATAILHPPNNWDSMTYHMPRVFHWVNNKNVSFYPTAITRQLYQMPLAEYAILNLQILTGSDLYANLVQWISFLVLICLGFLIAGELRLSSRQQIISAIMIATLPMAILQASSTQNDIVASVFLLSFAFFMLRLRKALTIEAILGGAMSLGLALLTKGTAFIYVATIGISLTVPVLMARKHDYRQILKITGALMSLVIMALLLNAGHFTRNYRLYGHPMSNEGEMYRNKELSIAALASNILRNGALHLGTPVRLINKCQERALQKILGPQLNNPKTTWEGTFFKIPLTLHEDMAGNLLHMLIGLCSIILLPVLWWNGHYRGVIWYTMGGILGAVLYCWILKWQPWASRLHTPLFALATPLLAITINYANIILKKRVGYLVFLFIILYGFLFAFANASRSLVSFKWCHVKRMRLYFTNNPSLYSGYESAVNVLKDANARDVGLYIGIDDWEYPFWVFAQRTDTNKNRMTFRHIGVNNISGTIKHNMTLPPYVITTKPIKSWEHVSKYTPLYTSVQVNVYKKLAHDTDTNTAGNSSPPYSQR